MRVNFTQGKEKGNNSPNETQTTPKLGPCSQADLSPAGATPSLGLGHCLGTTGDTGGFPFSPAQTILEDLLQHLTTRQ